MPDQLVPSVILWLPFLASIAAALWRTRDRRVAPWLMPGTALLGLLLSLGLYPAIVERGALNHVVHWVPTLGLDFSQRVDGLSWLCMPMICGIGLLVGIYARFYMPADDPLSRFFWLLPAFMGLMLGIVMSGNVIQLVFFRELRGLFSFPLMLAAPMICFSVAYGLPMFNEIQIGVFLTLTTPITLMLLVRTARHRDVERDAAAVRRASRDD